jgi:hypothetical protein
MHRLVIIERRVMSLIRVEGVYMKSGNIGAIVVLLSVSACATGGAVSSFAGVSAPVLLGPKDRVGVDTLAHATKLRDYHTVAYKLMTQTEDANYRYIHKSGSGEDRQAISASRAVGDDPGNDIRVKSIETSAWVVVLGSAEKTRVETLGEVVHVEAK